MILTVTLNPVLDKTLYLDRFPHGQISRSNRVENVAGGKGINVTRQLHCLGVQSVASGFLGGKVGDIIEQLMTDEGLSHDFVRVNDTTRMGVTILETDTGVQTSVFEPGHRVTDDEIGQLRDKVESCLEPRDGAERSDVDWLVCSGTVPCGGMDDLYADLIRIANAHNIPVVLDTYPEPLAIGIREKPFMVKPNVKEYLQTFCGPGRCQQTEASEEEIVGWLRNLRTLGVRLIVITQGEKPAYVAFHDRAWRVTQPSVESTNPTGSGDATVAGILYGFVQNWDIEDTLRFGIAAGVANARVWEVAASTLEEINGLVDFVKVEPL